MNELMLRRKLLLEQAELQRFAITKHIDQLKPSATVVEGIDSLRMLKKQPIWISGGLLLLFVFKPVHAVKQSAKWIRVAGFIYQSLHTMRIEQHHD